MCKYVRKGDDYIEFNMDAKGEEDSRTNHKKIIAKKLMDATDRSEILSVVSEEPQLLFGLNKTL